MRTTFGFGLRILVLVFSVGTAQAGPAVTDFTAHGTQPGLQSELLPSDDCLGCHGGFFDTQKQFMPHSTWSSSMMAHAGRDPLFWAALDVANHDLPGSGDFCLRCHAPEAWFGGRVSKDGSGGVVNGANGCLLLGEHDDGDQLGNDFSGVGCQLCHRQQATGALAAGVRHDSGNLFLDDSTECDVDDDGFPDQTGPCRIGPYRYPEAGIGSPPHAYRWSPSVKQSEFCGSCHDVSSPVLASGPARTLIDSAGLDTGIAFPLERSFSEWRASEFADIVFVDGFAFEEPQNDLQRYGQTCQTCHMPVSQDPTAMACQQNDPGSRSGRLPQHLFVGANTWVLDLIKNLYAGPAGLNREIEIDQSIGRARDLLTQASADLSLSLDPFTGPGNALTARVRVHNLAGHKLPTGYGEGRRMWLQVEARDGNGGLIYQSGAYDAATGVLNEDPDARVYEVQQGIWNTATSQCEVRDASNRKMFHFVLSNCVAKDNRIPPLGFRGGLDPELRPVAAVYPETAPGSGRLVNYDDAVYAIAVAAGTATPISVSVRLLHQVASREYIEFLNNVAVENALPSENLLCQPARPPLSTGPRTQTRAGFMADLWINNGRSPPELLIERAATTP